MKRKEYTCDVNWKISIFSKLKQVYFIMTHTSLGFTISLDILDFNGQKGKTTRMKLKNIRMTLHIRYASKRKEESWFPITLVHTFGFVGES